MALPTASREQLTVIQHLNTAVFRVLNTSITTTYLITTALLASIAITSNLIIDISFAAAQLFKWIFAPVFIATLTTSMPFVGLALVVAQLLDYDEAPRPRVAVLLREAGNDMASTWRECVSRSYGELSGLGGVDVEPVEVNKVATKQATSVAGPTTHAENDRPGWGFPGAYSPGVTDNLMDDRRHISEYPRSEMGGADRPVRHARVAQLQRRSRLGW